MSDERCPACRDLLGRGPGKNPDLEAVLLREAEAAQQRGCPNTAALYRTCESTIRLQQQELQRLRSTGPAVLHILERRCPDANAVDRRRTIAEVRKAFGL